MKKKNAIIVLITVASIIIIATVLILLISGDKDTTIYRIGQIEMRHYDVSSKIPGRIEWISADEGDSVSIGDEIAKLSDREVQAKFFQAEGAVESARAQLNMLIAGARKEEIDMAKRSFDAAVSQFELAEKTYNRMKSLYDDKLLSQQDLDVVFQKYSAARSQMEAARSQFEMAQSGVRIEQKDMARGQLNRALQSMEEVAAYLDESVVASPINGIIAKRYVNHGELVATGYPIYTIIDPLDVWLEVNLPAKELELIKIGDVLHGRIDGLGIDESFKVVNFSAMSDFANWRSTSDKATFDTRTFTVKLKPQNKHIASLRPGMTVRLKVKDNK